MASDDRSLNLKSRKKKNKATSAKNRKKMITIGELNLKLSPKLYKSIAKILIPYKDWVRYTKKKDIIICKATDGSEIYHHDYGYKFKPLYWNANTGYTFLEDIPDIKKKMKEIKTLIG